MTSKTPLYIRTNIYIMTENVPNLGKDTNIQIHER